MRTRPATTQVGSSSAMVRLCRFDALVPGEAHRFDVDGHRIAVVRIDETVYAIGDRCTHQNVSLSEGGVLVDDREIECYRHGSTFSLVTGEAMSLPATKPTPVFRVEVIEGDVYVKVGR